MAESRLSKWLIPVLTLLLGTVLGSGSVWEWKKHQLDVATQTAAFMQQKNDQYAKIIDLSNEYVRVSDENRERPSSKLRNKDESTIGAVGRRRGQFHGPGKQPCAARRQRTTEAHITLHSSRATECV